MRYLVLVSSDHHGRRLFSYFPRRSETGQVHSISVDVYWIVDRLSRPDYNRQRPRDDDDAERWNSRRSAAAARSATRTSKDEAREQGGQDARRHHGRVPLLLAAVLHMVHLRRSVRRTLSRNTAGRRLRSVLDRLHQLGAQSAHLRPVQSRLPARVPAHASRLPLPSTTDRRRIY